MNSTQENVDSFLEYVSDFYEEHGEWPTRNDYAHHLGRYERRSLPGVRGAINRGLIRYAEGDRLIPVEAYNTESGPDAPN